MTGAARVDWTSGSYIVIARRAFFIEPWLWKRIRLQDGSHRSESGNHSRCQAPRRRHSQRECKKHSRIYSLPYGAQSFIASVTSAVAWSEQASGREGAAVQPSTDTSAWNIDGSMLSSSQPEGAEVAAFTDISVWDSLQRRKV